MMTSPSETGSNGSRSVNGRFSAGNKFGKGNHLARQQASIRAMIVEAVTEDDLRAVIAVMVDRAKQGDMVAARELLNRLAGRPAASIDPEQLELQVRHCELRERQIDIQEDRIE